VSHADPVLAVSLGASFAVLSVWIVIDPGGATRVEWEIRYLAQLVGTGATNTFIRLVSGLFAVGSAWLALHGLGLA
jgi:hypothetical protein